MTNINDDDDDEDVDDNDDDNVEDRCGCMMNDTQTRELSVIVVFVMQ